jgi:hypothetical protein
MLALASFYTSRTVVTRALEPDCLARLKYILTHRTDPPQKHL